MRESLLTQRLLPCSKPCLRSCLQEPDFKSRQARDFKLFQAVHNCQAAGELGCAFSKLDPVLNPANNLLTKPGQKSLFERQRPTESPREMSYLAADHRTAKPPFVNNHVKDLVSVDFFTVPTATFQVLFVLVVLAHHRRRVIHFNVTEHPTALWKGQQIIEAFPDDTAPRYLLRDRDKVYGCDFRERVRGMGIEEVSTASASPWQRAYVERLIGSIRRDCLDHVIVLGEGHLRRILKSYLEYYHRSRTHLVLAKDSPEPRAVQSPELGAVVELPEVGGLHHRYERRAA